MSQWAHVAAVFRIDGAPRDPQLRERLLDASIGKFIQDVDWLDAEARGESPEDEERRAMYREKALDPDAYVPYGSEGTLQRLSVPLESGYASNLVAVVHGDLRDFGDGWGYCGNVHTLRRWFRRAVRGVYAGVAGDGGKRLTHASVRNAACDAWVEGMGHITFTFIPENTSLERDGDDPDGYYKTIVPDDAFAECCDEAMEESLGGLPDRGMGEIVPKPLTQEDLDAQEAELQEIVDRLMATGAGPGDAE